MAKEVNEANETNEANEVKKVKDAKEGRKEVKKEALSCATDFIPTLSTNRVFLRLLLLRSLLLPAQPLILWHSMYTSKTDDAL